MTLNNALLTERIMTRRRRNKEQKTKHVARLFQSGCDNEFWGVRKSSKSTYTFDGWLWLSGCAHVGLAGEGDFGINLKIKTKEQV